MANLFRSPSLNQTRLKPVKPKRVTPNESPLQGLGIRWRIERDYQELKQELGLGHFEGRGWRGFHHHATLCIAAYGFLVAERARIPPSGWATPKLTAIGLPRGDRPRSASDPTGAARAELNRNRAQEAHRGPGPESRAMSVLRNPHPQAKSSHPFMTQ